MTSKKSEDCEQVVCLEGDASGSYKRFAQKRFSNLSKMYEDDLSAQTQPKVPEKKYREDY